MAFYLYGRYVAGTGNCTGYSAIVSANGGTLGILVLAKWVPDYTVLGRYTFSEPAGDIPESTMELVMNGSDLSLKWNGTTRVTVSDATYANSRTGAAIGVYDNYTGESWLDTWQTGAVT
jgi:hypothetical protein